MSILDNVDDALAKACQVEDKMVAEKDPEQKGLLKRRANLTFRTAVELDGTPMKAGEAVL